MKTVVSTNLKRFREAGDYKQQDVAIYLKISRGAYANFESGDREMPFDLLEKVCEFYGIALSSLFEENGIELENELFCAFRIDNLGQSDFKEISEFKNVVRNYMKMCTII